MAQHRASRPQTALVERRQGPRRRRREQKLGAELGLFRILTGEQLAAWGVAAGGPFFMPTVLVRARSVPSYLEQPVALHFCASCDAYLAAKPKRVILLYGSTLGGARPKVTVTLGDLGAGHGAVGDFRSGDSGACELAGVTCRRIPSSEDVAIARFDSLERLERTA